MLKIQILIQNRQKWNFGQNVDFWHKMSSAVLFNDTLRINVTTVEIVKLQAATKLVIVISLHAACQTINPCSVHTFDNKMVSLKSYTIKYFVLFGSNFVNFRFIFQHNFCILASFLSDCCLILSLNEVNVCQI